MSLRTRLEVLKLLFDLRRCEGDRATTEWTVLSNVVQASLWKVMMTVETEGVRFRQRERERTTPEVVGRLASVEYLSLQSGCEVIGRDLSETGGLSDLLIKTYTLS